MIKITFDKIEVSMSSTTEVFELTACKLDVVAGGELLIDTGRANFITNSDLMRFTARFSPALIPNPDIATIMEELATMTGGDGAEKGATETGFGVDQLGTSRTTAKKS